MKAHRASNQQSKDLRRLVSDFVSYAFEPEVFLVWTSLLKTVVLLAIILGFVSYTVYAERKVCAFIQDRVGPNRVGSR